jgi:hypothetical protein
MIFPFVWRLMPGPIWCRLLLLLAVVAAVVWGLFTVVFPWLAADVLPAPDGSVG